MAASKSAEKLDLHKNLFRYIRYPRGSFSCGMLLGRWDPSAIGSRISYDIHVTYMFR